MTQKEGMSLDTLDRNIAACLVSRQHLKVAVAEQRKSISDNEKFLRDLEYAEARGQKAPNSFSIPGLKHGIEQAHGHIVSLNEASNRERESVRTFEKMKRDIIKASEKMAEALANVHININGKDVTAAALQDWDA